MDVHIATWEPRFAADVARLSREWIERDFVSKPEDEAYYADPAGEVVAKGGEIFAALDANGRCVGTAAARPWDAETVELCKLGVTAAAQGRGIGRALCRAVLDWSRTRGARRVLLMSNARLLPALRLYESLGFVRKPLPFPAPHEDVDVYMELAL